MVPEPIGYVYLMAGASRVLYTGITSDLRRRVWQHKTGSPPGFTQGYRVTRLVHYEWTGHIRVAIEREREIKSWRREKKIQLIEAHDPAWIDLALDWFPDLRGQGPSLRAEVLQPFGMRYRHCSG
ncbi:MAG TPA: GIY-YIG nuclease family protein [Gemmatimonadales bacterium]|nr:GIY-YIG nuclease family protein [Gemmatimonadales bacterium]